MRAYICDACGKVIADPFEVGMKKFDMLVDESGGALMPVARAKRVTVHLCGDCFHGLHLIAENALREAEECTTS